MVYIPPDVKVEYKGNDEGFVQDILKGLRSIPHLPAALSEGWDDPSLSPEEADLRKRSVSEAAMWVIPALVSGGAGALLKGAGPLVSTIVDAAGVAAGSAASAKVQGEDPVKASLIGGAFGGVIGGAVRFGHEGAAAARRLAASEAAAAAEAAAQRAAKGAADRASTIAEAMNAEVGRPVVAAEGPKITISGGPARTTGGFDPHAEALSEAATREATGIPFDPTRDVMVHPKPGTKQLDAFDFGLGPIHGTEPNTATPLGGQLDVFGGLPSQADASRLGGVPQTAGGALAERELVDSYAAKPRQQEELFNEFLNQRHRLTAAEQESSFESLLARASGATEGAAKGAKKVKAPKISAMPSAEQNMAETLNEISPTAVAEGTKMASGIVKPAAELASSVAPDERLAGVMKNTGDALAHGWFLGGAGTKVLKLAKKAQDAANQSAVFTQGMEFVRRALVPSRKLLAAMGPTGAMLSKTLDNIFEEWRARGGKDVGRLRDILINFTPKERIHIGRVMEGLEIAGTDTYRKAAETVRMILDEYAQEAEALGIRELLPNGSIVEFRKMLNYLPHYYTDAAIKKFTTPGTPEFKALLRQLEKSASVRDDREAVRLIQRFLHAPSEFRTGPINFARSMDLPGYEQDPLKAVSRYIYDVRKRLEIARQFGNDYRKVKPILEQIGLEGGNARAANNITDAFFGKINNDYKALTKATSTWTILTMLSTSGVIQPAQLLNAFAAGSAESLFKALGAAMTRDGKEWAIKTGGFLDEVVQDMLGTDATNVSQFYLKYMIGLEPLDKANRIVSALVGRFEAERLAGKLMATKSKRAAGLISEQLGKLGLDAAEIVGQGGKLTSDQLLTAGRRMSLDTQFASSVMDLPEFRTHPMGKLIYQFRGFALQQTEFIQKSVMSPAWAYINSGGRRGSLAPLVKYSSALGPTGAVIGELVRTLKGRPEPDTATMKVIENIAYAGGFGIWYDTVNAFASGKDKILSFMAGPAASELTAFLGEGAQAFMGKPESLTRHAIRRIPIVGQPLANYWFMPPK